MGIFDGTSVRSCACSVTPAVTALCFWWLLTKLFLGRTGVPIVVRCSLIADRQKGQAPFAGERYSGAVNPELVPDGELGRLDLADRRERHPRRTVLPGLDIPSARR